MDEKVKKQLTAILLAGVFCFAVEGYCEIASENDALNYVYSLTDVFNWKKNNPPMIQIIKGFYAAEGQTLQAGRFLGWGVISDKTWNKLKLEDDKIYRKRDVFIIERNVCILPNLKPRNRITVSNYPETTRGAMLVRIRETLTNKRYSYATLGVITDNPPLREIFHWE